MDNTKLVAITGSSDCGFSHQTSSSTHNFVSAKQPRKNSSIVKTENGSILLIREVTSRGRGIQGKSVNLIIQARRQSTKKQYECYLRKWVKFSGSQEIDPLQSPINVAIEYFYMTFMNQEVSIVALGQPDLH